MKLMNKEELKNLIIIETEFIGSYDRRILFLSYQIFSFYNLDS